MRHTEQRLIEPGLYLADLIIHLEHKSILSQWIILIKRHRQRDNETLKGLLELMRHTLFKKYHLGYRKGKMTPTEIIEPHKHKVITLFSFKEINEFINSL